MPDASEIISRRKADALVTGARYSSKAHSLQGSITKRLLNLGRQRGLVDNRPPVSSFTILRANNDYFDVSWTYENTGSSVFEGFYIYGITKSDYDATPNPTFTLWQRVFNQSATYVAAPATLSLFLLSGTDYVLRIIVYYTSGISTPVDIDGKTTSS